MTDLKQISDKLDALPAAIATAVIAALPSTTPTDNTVVLTAIEKAVTDITYELKANVEGVSVPPVTTPAA